MMRVYPLTPPYTGLEPRPPDLITKSALHCVTEKPALSCWSEFIIRARAPNGARTYCISRNGYYYYLFVCLGRFRGARGAENRHFGLFCLHNGKRMAFTFH